MLEWGLRTSARKERHAAEQDLESIRCRRSAARGPGARRLRPLGDPAEPAPTATEGAEPAPSPIAVEATGDGPVGLAATEDLSAHDVADDARQAHGRPVTGPGDCFSLAEQDRPKLLVFGHGADFTLEGERPSVDDPAAGTVRVGERAELTVTTMPIDDIEGVPNRCSRGASGDALVVIG